VSKQCVKIRSGPDGVHFFDRETGLNVLLDEIAVPPSGWATAPRQVSIALTNRCDLSCAHCYAPKNKAVLDFDRLSMWLLELDANECLGVGFGGGEPTLHPEFAKVCKFAACETGLAVSFTTHGHHLNQELLEELRGTLNFIRVSMDGIGPVYEKIRGRTYDGLIKKIQVLSKYSLFGINYLVNEETIGHLDEAYVVSSDLGASEFVLLPEHKAGSLTAGYRRIEPKLREWVARVRMPIRVSISELGAEGFSTCEPFCKEAPHLSYAHVDANGFLRRNSFSSVGVEIGNSSFASAFEKLGRQGVLL
jgi:MoaA/NifB/PqqE/SkfB family radical SAM enzyme